MAKVKDKPEEKLRDKKEVISELKGKIDKARNYMSTNYTAKLWPILDDLYNRIVRALPGVKKWQSKFASPIIFQAVQDELPKTLKGLFGENDFFALFPRQGMDDEKKMKSAKALQGIMKWNLENGNAFKAFHDCIQWGKRRGIGWVKCYWRYEKETRKYFDIKEGNVVTVTSDVVKYDEPWFEAPDPKDISFYCGAKSYTDIQGIVQHGEVYFSQVKAWEGLKQFDSEEIRRFLYDKRGKKVKDFDTFEIEYVYEHNNWYFLLDHNYLIKDHPNPLKSGIIPFFPYIRYSNPDKVIGEGLGGALRDLTEMDGDMERAKADNIIQSVNTGWIKKHGATIYSASGEIGLSDIIEMDNPEDLKKRENPPVGAEIFNQVVSIQQRADRVVGAFGGITSPQGMSTVNNKTATGAEILKEESEETNDLDITFNKKCLVRPLVKHLIEMYQQYLDVDRFEKIIGEKAMKDLEIEKADIDLKSDYDFIITGDKGFYGKRKELEMITNGLSLMSTLGDAAMARLNVKAISDRIGKVMDWPKEFFIDEDGEMKLDPAAEAQLAEVARILETDPAIIKADIKAGKVTIEQVVQKAEEVKSKAVPV
jgi:hypothetical protein